MYPKTGSLFISCWLCVAPPKRPVIAILLPHDGLFTSRHVAYYAVKKPPMKRQRAARKEDMTRDADDVYCTMGAIDTDFDVS